MTHSDPGGPKGSGRDAADSPEVLPAAARWTLDDIADALGVTASLLRQEHAHQAPGDEDSAKLVEAAALLQAFVRISNPALRRSCIAFVQDASEQDRNRT